MRKFKDFKCLLGLLLLAIGATSSCQKQAGKTTNRGDDHLFSLLPASLTHIDFNNTLTEGMNTNVLMYEYFYNGGGVAVGDLNGDGMQDIYFTANMQDNKLYINKGNLTFEDVTNPAGVAGRPGPWKTGTTLADVNGDGKLDIFVCYSGNVKAERRIPQLFINQGNDKNGIPSFADMAWQCGLNVPSFSTSAYFFDYDLDGDLDLLLVNHNPDRISNLDEVTVKKLTDDPDKERGLRLFRNEKGHFRDVTVPSGIKSSALSYGLSAGIADIDGDGWPDIYVSNDYNMPDRLYKNNANGTFTDRLQESVGHTSYFSMGNDIADINNDSKPDIYTLDMLPEDNRRQKLLFAADNYESFNLNLKEGFYYQYMRNMLHLNNGNGTFSEIGQLAGVSNTDWSWAPLLADYDNDGWKDLFITNGYTRDYTNMDFLKYMGDNLRDRKVMRQDLLNIVRQMPSSKVKSYLFKNNGNLTFKNTSASWGISQTSNSNGAAYADLDNDGDLDLVVNNINDPAFIYKNNSEKKGANHYLQIRLVGKGMNTGAIGAKMFLHANGLEQYQEEMPSRGFQSSVSPVIHFGLGLAKQVDSLSIVWPSGAVQTLYHIIANQQVTIVEGNAVERLVRKGVEAPFFTSIKSPVAFGGRTSETNDFKRQPLMVNPMSFSGPCMVKGDVNGDGLEDIYIGGADGQAGMLYQQEQGNRFLPKPQVAFSKDKRYNDAAALFFDANADGKLDLYVCSGGYGDLAEADPLLQDRLYLNNGKGAFTRAENSIPKMRSSKSCVRSADINGDGYPDLFVGGRVIPGRYPEAPESYILINDGAGHFSDQTTKYNAGLLHAGMVTDAAWADMNNDKKPDLVIVGEWMPVTILINTNGKLVDQTNRYLDRNYAGWWNCINIGDFNDDGHPDMILGNLGLNSQCKASAQEPVEMLYKDFDDNGSVDPILLTYVQHKSYPYVTRDELLDQISIMRTRFPDYKSYADATTTDIFTPEELRGSKLLKANTLQTLLLESDRRGKLHTASLPLQAQFSPVFTITKLDYNKDGKEDLLLCGNITHARIRFGKYDANYGLLLKGDGKGRYSCIPQERSGFNIRGDVRSVVQINDMLLLGVNGQGLKAYKSGK
jgi:hypothetical protein